MTPTTHPAGRVVRLPGKPAAYLLMLGGAFAFASMNACAHGLRERCDWRVVATARSAIAFLVTYLIARRMRVPLVWPGPRTLWIRSIFGSIGMVCTFFALTHLRVSESVTLMNSFPLWVALLSWPVLRLRPSAGGWFAIICGLAGVSLIGSSEGGAIAPPDIRWLASGLALITSFCTAIVMLGLNRLRYLHPLAIATHFGGISALGCLVVVIVTVAGGGSLTEFAAGDATTWLLLAGTGLLGSAGQVLMTTAFQHGAPDRLAAVALTQSVFALFYDLAIWNHHIDPRMLSGMVLVLAPASWIVTVRRPNQSALALR